MFKNKKQKQKTKKKYFQQSIMHALRTILVATAAISTTYEDNLGSYFASE
jgi:hypothetical protein